jgi:tRNA(fMet)-specific endonuclease VapC
MAARIASAPQVYISSTVLGELYYGAYGSPTRPDAAVADVETIERTVAALSSDSMTARIYAQIKLDLKKRELTIPDNDLWIAALAIQYNVTLAAHDAHFD